MYLESVRDIVPDLDAGDTLAICFSGDFGLGVQALARAAKCTVLDRFTGIVGPELSQHSLQVRPGLHITDTRFIGYLTHSCDPNCYLDMRQFELIALRDIAADDLLTIDYAATEDVLHVQFPCNCNTDACRLWITGRRDPINSAGALHLAKRTEHARVA